MKKSRFALYMCIFGAAAVLSALLGCAAGAAQMSLPEVIDAIFTGSGTSGIIVRTLRLPRVLAALLVGGALPVCGCALQGLFKNPMADTGILGISAGASLGVTFCLLFCSKAAGLISTFAFIFGCLTVVLIYGLSRICRGSTLGLILSGVCVSAFLSAIQNFLLMSDNTKLEQVYGFMMGSLSGASWQQLSWSAPLIIAGCTGIMLLARPLNLLQSGSEQAVSAGLNEPAVRVALLALSALVCSSAVALSGTISFVGLIIPHCMRYLTGGDFRRLLPLSFVCGSGFMVLADLLARTVIAPLELPIGVLTAILGAPLFFSLMVRRRDGAKD